jgi:hypothetical protein
MAITAVNGVTVTEDSTIMGISGLASIFGQALASGEASYTLLWDSFNAGTSSWPIGGEGLGYGLGGVRNWVDASARTIGKVSVKLLKSGGDISGQTYTCKIYTSDPGATNNFQTLLATSNSVAGSNAWSNTIVDFIFPTPYTTTGGVAYNFVFGTNSNDNTNYASGYHTDSNTMADATLGSWNYSGLSAGVYGGLDFQAQIYTTP